MIYATDLDRTVIFSSKFLLGHEKDVTCVEHKEDKEISYMLNESLRLLDLLMNKKDLIVIPVTTRSVEQYQRVTPFQKCKYAVVANGGIILYNNNMVFKPWQEKIEKILTEYQKYESSVLEFMKDYEEYFDSDIRKVDNIFYFVKLKDDKEKNEELLKILDRSLDKSLWNFTLQGLKLYIIPKEITKENALLFLKKYLNETYVITSGDGKLDKDFIILGNKVFIPMYSEVLDYMTKQECDYSLISDGLIGTPELFKAILNICRR